MEGTIELVDGGDFIAVQMWEVVSKSISYSSTLMSKLFDTFGATVDECSPFCQSFFSLQDLRNKLINYLPYSFTNHSIMSNSNEGTPTDATVEPEDTNMPSQEAMADRIRCFANEMNKANKRDENKNANDDVKSISPNDDSKLPDTATTTNVTVNSQELMTHFQGIINSSIDDMLCNILAASACLERKDNIKGAINLIHKGKLLVQHQLTKPASAIEKKGTCETGDILIERDIVLLVNTKIGTGASASDITLPYHVVHIYNKHCNKQFISKSKSLVKIWKKETKPCKLKLRMLGKNAINEYYDINLNNSGTFSKDSICRIVREDIIVCVIRKLEARL